MTARPIRATLLALAAVLVSIVPASAARLLDTHVRAKHAVRANCIAQRRSGPGVTTRRLIAARTGYLTARLRGGAKGDWDLAVFARGQREPVAASAYRGSVEVASGFVTRGDRLVVQACRRSGRGRSVSMSVGVRRVPGARARASLVRVHAGPAALRGLHLDAAEHSGPGFADVVLHGRRDARKLARAGLKYTRVTAAAPDASQAGALPGGSRTTYRRLADYGAEMKALARQNPDLVKPFTLAHPSWQGRPLEGLEITTEPNARDGKPVFLMLGLHHAREWPSGEFTLEWAYEMVKDFKTGDPRTTSLLAHARVIIVPVVNPDGFNFSREAGQTNGHAGGDTGFDGSNAEYHRKNCRLGTCTVSGGVDINRNYGDRWGGEGGTDAATSETYRGPAPFSEPEAQDIRELISARQVTTMITNHTYANEILRQPGAEDDFPTPDEAVYKQLGDAMGAEAGYESVASYTLYAPNDHVGTTDGWSYFTTGGLGYVFEAMSNAFHPPYAQVVQHYEMGSGLGGAATGNRGAFFLALESTADPTRHAVLTGSAPAGSILRLTKSFTNRTTLGPPTDEHFETSMEVPASGQFEWHVNQSGRPLFPAEQWTLTCERPEGTVLTTQQVSVGRGQSVPLDLSGCGTVEPPGKPKPDLTLKLTAKFGGRFYRLHATGELGGVDPGPGAKRCAGKVAVKIAVRKRTVRSGSTPIDAGCGFDRSFRFSRHSLPKSLRKRTVRRFRASASFVGNDFLAAASRSVSARVQRRPRP